MGHRDLRIPLQGGLKGTLPRAFVRNEHSQLVIARQVYGAKVVGGAQKGATGPIGATGAQQPPGAAWSTLIPGNVLQTPTNPVPRLITGTYLIKELVVVGDQVGSCVINIWKSNIISGHYPPVSGDDITGGHNVVLAGVQKLVDSTLTGWTTTLAQDDMLLFSLASVSTFTYLQIQLRLG